MTACQVLRVQAPQLTSTEPKQCDSVSLHTKPAPRGGGSQA